MLSSAVGVGGYDLGIAFDGDGDRMLAVDGSGEAVDGDQILAICALALGVDLVVVTTMTNMGFHRLMADHGIRVVTTDVGDRYVLEALRAEGGILGGEQSGHVIVLDGHVTGDGLAAALTLCRSLDGRTLGDAAAEMPRFAQAKENIVVPDTSVPSLVSAEVERWNRELDGRGRVMVRPSGTEPLIRVLAEAERPEEAAELCASIAALVRRESRDR
jgi:phosphoglucosamine mutase